MKKTKTILSLALSICLVISLAGCGNLETTTTINEDVTTTTEAESDESVDQISEIVSSMTVEQKISQMIVISMRSDVNNTKSVTELTQEYKDIIQKYDFGGVLLMIGNFVDTDQTVNLIYDCQEAAKSSELGIPMFISTDQEGGRVNRMSYGSTGPGNMAMAASGDTELTKEFAGIIGRELSSVGCNVDFAPVSDVNNNPNNPIINVRSFSDDPEIVAENVGPFIEGLKENNILVSLKHFPGHGNVSEDSHTHLPCSEYTLEELKSLELIPFEAGIRSGADMIMTAHIQYPEIEKETYISKEDGKEVYLPATLSRKIMHDILRGEMGFDGLIVTDAMKMDAIATHFDPIDAGTMAINADVDVLLEPVFVYKDDEIDTFNELDEYIAGLVARVESGEISESELDDSVYRIIKCKMESGIYDNALTKSREEMKADAKKTVGSAEHHEKEWEMAEKCMTLIKNDDSVLPLDGNNEEKTLLLYPNEEKEYTVDYALSRLEKDGLIDRSKVTSMSFDGLYEDDEALQSSFADSDRIIVITMVTEYNEELDKILDKADDADKKTILLSLNMPYTASCYDDVDAILCGFNSEGTAHDGDGNGPFNMNIAVAIGAIYGSSVPQGKLPLNIPEISETTDDGIVFSAEDILYKRGFGLMNWGE